MVIYMNIKEGIDFFYFRSSFYRTHLGYFYLHLKHERYNDKS